MKEFCCLFSLLLFFVTRLTAGGCNPNDSVPFSVDSTSLTVWNGTKYVPFFVKGINLGASVPGKFPGELDVTKQQYVNWIVRMKEAGFNVIRLYTLHMPHFYQVLDSINDANPQNPMYIFQGVWLDEDIPNYHQDVYELTSVFDQEINDNVDCMHGNKVIAQRPGKAWGSFATDVSKWVMGYITGREVYPDEVLNANLNHAGTNSFSGPRISISAATPTEAWIAERLNHLVTYEYQYYQTMRPVSFSSWPTLDPLAHPEEPNRGEDTVWVNLANLDISNAPAGYFASYHAYPYYPDFMSNDPAYANFTDDIGQNSYLGYLTFLKQAYKKFPLIIAEYGVPSSWVSAHFAQSGMHHGGFDERQQGENNMRILRNMQTAGCGGGMTFAWIDEWFKRTWIADPLDYDADSRILWHNLTSAEQNFGLVGFQKQNTLQNWQSFSPGSSVTTIKAAADYDFFKLRLDLANALGLPDTLWITFDTYAASLGESILPEGQTVSNRAEFALRITNYSAELYVTEAYDLFGIWHNSTTAAQVFQSVVSNGGKWNLVRMRNNNVYSDVQYIGNLQVNKGGLLASSKDAVTIYDDHIDIKLPWSYLQFTAPDKMKVFHDYKNIVGSKDTTSDGISVTVFHNGFVLTPSSRFSWPLWNTALDVQEQLKTSYHVMKNQLPLFNSKANALCDQYTLLNAQQPDFVNAASGVLKNDFDMDGNVLQATLFTAPSHGNLTMNKNGSFAYTPDAGYTGPDYFQYCVYDGMSLSEPADVYLSVLFNTGVAKAHTAIPVLRLYPNPAHQNLTVEAAEAIQRITIFTIAGEQVADYAMNEKKTSISIEELPPGIYLLKADTRGQSYMQRLVVK